LALSSTTRLGRRLVSHCKSRSSMGSGVEPMDSPNTPRLLCPSAQPDIPGSVIFGVIQGTPQDPRLVQLTEPQPTTTQILDLAAPVKPTEVFRFAAPCAEFACRHFDGNECQLAGRIVSLLSSVEAPLAPCHIRRSCRWWHQEGKAACMRCPMIVTESATESETMIEAAGM
jgi:hypothetical protein